MKKSNIISELQDFLLLWSSQAVSGLGTAMTEYALINWTYQQEGTASSVTLLTLCSFLPTIIFRFTAGALADRWDKKRIMLLSDLFAAFGTMTVFLLYSFSALRIWHLYLINVLLSFMNAFQAPASFAATSLLVPKKYYTRAGGLQGFSGAAISILAPALGSVLLTCGGIKAVLVCDLVSFAAAITVLLFFVRIPGAEQSAKKDEPFLVSCLDGLRWLREHKPLLRMTLFMAAVNFLAKLGSDGMISPFVLARTGNDQRILGLVQSSVALGLLAGSFAVTLMKPARSKTRVVFTGCALIFTGNLFQSLSVQPWVWCAAAFGAYMTAAVMNANLTAVMRDNIPDGMQGRVFSAKDTLQNCTIPPALFLGGILADHLFEPFMVSEHPILSPLFGSGKGAGIALMFFCVGTLGVLLSLTHLKKTEYRELDECGN